jgi:hypothetical protein
MAHDPTPDDLLLWAVLRAVAADFNRPLAEAALDEEDDQ